MARTPAARQRYSDRVEQGLCVLCGAKAISGTRCEDCKEKYKATQENVVAEKKNFGMCTACRQPAKEGCVLCQDCITKRSKVSSEGYAARRASGKCSLCNNEPAPGRVLCQYHIDKTKDYRTELKLAAIEAYGGKCSGCEETDFELLSVSIEDDAERKATASGHSLYQRLKKDNYPPGFRILCPCCSAKARIARRKANLPQ